MNRAFSFIAAMMLSAVLTGCGEPTMSGGSAEGFRDSYAEVRGSLSDSERDEFDVAVRKLVAFTAFDTVKLDFSRGVVDLDLASVLPKDFLAFQNAAFARIGPQVEGKTGKEVIAQAAAAQAEVVSKYQAAVDRGIASFRKRVDGVLAEQRRKTDILAKIGILSASLSQEAISGGSYVPTLTFEVHNKTAAVLGRLDLRAVIGEEGDPDAISDGFAVELGAAPMTAGEIRRIRLRMGGLTWSSGTLATAHRLPVALSVLRYRDTAGNVLDATAPELAELTRTLDSLTARRAQAASVIDSSFRTR